MTPDTHKRLQQLGLMLKCALKFWLYTMYVDESGNADLKAGRYCYHILVC
jgi:hypothetical protein